SSARPCWALRSSVVGANSSRQRGQSMSVPAANASAELSAAAQPGQRMMSGPMGVSRVGGAARPGGLLAAGGQQGHEPGPLQRRGGGPLEGGAVAGALAAEQLALAGAELLEALHVLVVHERRPRAAVLRAEAAAVLAAPAQFLTNHCPVRCARRESIYHAENCNPSGPAGGVNRRGGRMRVGKGCQTAGPGEEPRPRRLDRGFITIALRAQEVDREVRCATACLQAVLSPPGPHGLRASRGTPFPSRVDLGAR